jgi:hypothetical protein
LRESANGPLVTSLGLIVIDPDPPRGTHGEPRSAWRRGPEQEERCPGEVNRELVERGERLDHVE